MKKIISSFMGITAVFTFMFSSGNVTNTPKALARIILHSMFILEDNNREKTHNFEQKNPLLIFLCI
ncbi:hypothetical protein BCM0074_3099 [Bacillus cereus]|nr:hypothetical protein BCM0074_3099 [Bacillus cereus]